MNVKPGDIARIVTAPHEGKLVSVLSLAPTGTRRLPDGQRSIVSGSDYWVVESLGSPFPALLVGGKTRQARFVTIQDRHLRPIRDPGDDATDEMVRIAGNPNHKPTDAETAEEHQRRVAPDYLTGQGA